MLKFTRLVGHGARRATITEVFEKDGVMLSGFHKRLRILAGGRFDNEVTLNDD